MLNKIIELLFGKKIVLDFKTNNIDIAKLFIDKDQAKQFFNLINNRYTKNLKDGKYEIAQEDKAILIELILSSEKQGHSIWRKDDI